MVNFMIGSLLEKMRYVKSKNSNLPKENSLLNKRLYKLFLEGQLLHGKNHK